MELKIKLLGAVLIALIAMAVIIIIANNSHAGDPSADVTDVNAEIKLLKPSEFESLIDNNRDSNDVFVINTHAPYMGEIEGTDLIIEDWENLASHSSQLPQDKNAPVLVYCRSGRMSASAAQQLKEMGYNKIYDLEGGMNAWIESGRELVNKTDN